MGIAGSAAGISGGALLARRLSVPLMIGGVVGGILGVLGVQGGTTAASQALEPAPAPSEDVREGRREAWSSAIDTTAAGVIGVA